MISFSGDCLIMFDNSEKNCGEALEKVTVECRYLSFLSISLFFYFFFPYNFICLVGLFLVER